jgi:hypothetical protein
MRLYILDTSFFSGGSQTPLMRVYPSYLHAMTLPSGHALSILSTSAKWEKDKESLFVVAGVYLSPHRKAGFKLNLCPFALSCHKTCIDDTGNMSFHSDSRIRRTLALYAYSDQWIQSLIMEIRVLAFKCSLLGKELWIRLNGTSDIRWEKILDLAGLVNEIQGLAGFYDYSKFPFQERETSDQYRLCYSYDEGSHAQSRALEYLRNDQAVAVVVSFKDYKKYKDDPRFVDGESNDFRFLDGGSIVLLRAKRLFKGRSYDSEIVQPIGKALALCEVYNG